MKNHVKSTRYLAEGAMIAALYTILTLLAASLGIAFGPVQFRFSEALTLLPIFTPAAIPGLTLGCLLSNIFSGYGVYDMIFGTLATLLSALATRWLRNVCFGGLPVLAPLPPVLFNAVIVGAEIVCLSPTGFAWPAFWSTALSVGLGELVVCYVLGLPLTAALKKTGAASKIFRNS